MRWTPTPVQNRADRERRDEVPRIPPREIPPPRVDRPHGAAPPQLPDVLARQQLHERAKAARKREEAILHPPGQQAMRRSMVADMENNRAKAAAKAAEAERLRGWVPCGPKVGALPPANPDPMDDPGEGRLQVGAGERVLKQTAAPGADVLGGSAPTAAPGVNIYTEGGSAPTLAAPQHRENPPASPGVGPMGVGQAADAAPTAREIPPELRAALERLAALQFGWRSEDDRRWVLGSRAKGRACTRLVVYMPMRVEWMDT